MQNQSVEPRTKASIKAEQNLTSPNWSALGFMALALTSAAVMFPHCFPAGHVADALPAPSYTAAPSPTTQGQPVRSESQPKSDPLADVRNYGYVYGKQWAPLAAKLGVLSLKSAPSKTELDDLADIQWLTYSTLPDDGRPKIQAILGELGPQADHHQVKMNWQAGFKRGVEAGLKPELERNKRDRAPAF